MQTIYPTFRYHDAVAAIDWLTGTLGFTERARHMDANRVAHAELSLGASLIMVGQVQDDAFGALVGAPAASAQGGKALYLAVDDVDALFARVAASGVQIAEPLTERDYGSREFICRDPEGNLWCFGTYRPE